MWGAAAYRGRDSARRRGATLAAWIVDPHGVKPGVNMPAIKLEPDEVQPLAAYLEGLK